jgi:polysaccharide biosynthesis protein PelD
MTEEAPRLGPSEDETLRDGASAEETGGDALSFMLRKGLQARRQFVDAQGQLAESARAVPDTLPPRGARAASVVSRPRRVRAGAGRIQAVTEAVFITALVPAIGAFANPGDPFYLSTGFPWLAVAPLLIGLRHGSTLGLASAVALDIGLAIAWRTQIVPLQDFPGDAVIGLFALAMLCGLFSDAWKREVRRLNAAFREMRGQVDQLSRYNFLLELSHERVEAQLARPVPSLHKALAAARSLATNASAVSLDLLGRSMIEVFASYCMVEDASLVAVERGIPSGAPVATHGKPAALRADDPLVVAALQSGRLAYVPRADANEAPTSEASPWLLVLPLVDTAGRAQAILCVRSIPFFAFERQNLATLGMLGGHFADLIALGGEAMAPEAARRRHFEVRLARALIDYQQHQTASALVHLVLQHGTPIADILDVLVESALDDFEFPLVVRRANGDLHGFFVLPHTEHDAAARAARARLERITKQELRLGIEEAGGRLAAHTLKTASDVAIIHRLVDDSLEGPS